MTNRIHIFYPQRTFPAVFTYLGVLRMPRCVVDDAVEGITFVVVTVEIRDEIQE